MCTCITVRRSRSDSSAGDVLTNWESAGPSSCGVPAVFSQPVRRTRCSAGNARRLRGSLCRGGGRRRLLHRVPQCTGNPRRLGEQSKLSAVGTSVAQNPRTREAPREMGAEACYADAAASGSSRSISCPTPAESEVPVQQACEGLRFNPGATSEGEEGSNAASVRCTRRHRSRSTAAFTMRHLCGVHGHRLLGARLSAPCPARILVLHGRHGQRVNHRPV